MRHVDTSVAGAARTILALLVGGCASVAEHGATGDAGYSGGSSNSGNAGSGAGGGRTGTTSTTSLPVPTADANCGQTTVGLNKIPPDLLVVLDRSGSMNDRVDGAADSKWVEMTAAITQSVMQSMFSIRWGLKMFPDGLDACGVMPGVLVPVADNSAAAVTTALADPMQVPMGGRTPTRAGMQTATAYLKGLADPNPKFILLATDGQPNCATPADTGAADVAGAVQAVMDAATMGIPTYVIGIATAGSNAEQTLNDMAVAGRTPRPVDPKYYPVANQADLVAALAKIGGQISACVFGLGSVPPDPSNIVVESDLGRIPRDKTHMSGWDYGTGMMSVQLYGSYCEAAKGGMAKSLRAIFGCPGIVIP